MYETFMQRAIELARKGGGYVHPNPLVGCVIVKDNQIISEGYHEYYGGAHAEVNAIKNLEDKGFSEWDKVTLFVTLEPCVHFGKTPPCSNLIIEKGIKNVVVASVDVNPVVSGKGIKKLRDNGIQVITGVLEEQAIELNKRFITYHTKNRPYIILKWAETKDGFISKVNFQSREENIISSQEALKIVHRWRSEEQSIMVGYHTIIKDNPHLNVRYAEGKNPVKIIYDKYASLNLPNYNVYLSDEKIIVLNEIKNADEGKVVYVKMDTTDFAKEISKHLYEQHIVSVLVEGGKKLLQKFIDAQLFDEIRIIKSKSKVFKEGIPAPHLPEDMQCVETIDLKDDVIKIYK